MGHLVTPISDDPPGRNIALLEPADMDTVLWSQNVEQLRILTKTAEDTQREWKGSTMARRGDARRSSIQTKLVEPEPVQHASSRFY